jgi:peptide/nickel transport system permease protein
MEDIRRTFPATIELATLGILIGAGLGIPLGVWAAVRRGGLVDQIVRVMGLVGYSVPIFWLGLMGLVLFYAKLGWVAGPGRIDVAFEYSSRRNRLPAARHRDARASGMRFATCCRT